MPQESISGLLAENFAQLFAEIVVFSTHAEGDSEVFVVMFITHRDKMLDFDAFFEKLLGQPFTRSLLVGEAAQNIVGV